MKKTCVITYLGVSDHHVCSEFSGRTQEVDEFLCSVLIGILTSCYNFLEILLEKNVFILSRQEPRTAPDLDYVVSAQRDAQIQFV